MIMDQNERNNHLLYSSLRPLRVVDLKEIIRSISVATAVWVPVTGTKDLLISRIVEYVSIFAKQPDDKLEVSLSIINSAAGARYGERYWIAHDGVVYNQPSLTADERARMNTPGLYPGTATSSSSPSSSSTPLLPPVPPQPRPPQPPQPTSHPNNSSTRSTVTYKSGPFYAVMDVLCMPKVCEASPFSRNSQIFRFTLNNRQRRLLGSTDPEFQIQFCCAALPALSTNNPLLLEFPPICELKVNNHTIPAQSVRGLKNKPGTVNPANITTMCSIQSPNHIELVYANTGKKYVGSIQFVQRIPIETLVTQMIENRYISKDMVLEKYRQQQEDADIVMESETLSLKCPLAFSRIKLPCRSIMCKHAQCYDATTFLAMNEQTPTWSCPVCNRRIESFDDLIVDGFYVEVLKTVGTEVESFKIDSDGNIQLADEQRAQARVKLEENTVLSVDSAFVPKERTAILDQPSPLSADGDYKQQLPPILASLSSPSSPASQTALLHQLLPQQSLPLQQSLPPLSLLPLSGSAPPRKEVEVIDLTLDSDDE